jgi:hypothetical protein
MAERRVFAKRQAGFDFHRGLHKEKAQGMWREAVAAFKLAVRAPEDRGSRERHINASLFCSVVICLDMLGEYAERDRYLRQWEAEHPDDSQVERQRDYLAQKRRRLTGSALR